MLDSIHSSAINRDDSRTDVFTIRAQSRLHTSHILQSLLAHTQFLSPTMLFKLFEHCRFHTCEITSADLANVTEHSRSFIGLANRNAVRENESRCLRQIPVGTIAPLIRHVHQHPSFTSKT